MKKISLLLIMLMVMPLAVNALSQERYTNYIIINVFDGLSYNQIADVNIKVFTGDWDFICDVYRTDEVGVYVTEVQFYEGETILIHVIHDDYYIQTYEYTTPLDVVGEQPFSTSTPLFKKGVDVATSLPEIYDVVSGTVNLVFRFQLNDIDTIFGAQVCYDAGTDDVILGPVFVLKTSEFVDVIDADLAWWISGDFYYSFDMSPIYEDSNNPSDGFSIYNVELVLSEDVNITGVIVDGYVEGQNPFSTYDGPVSLVYDSGTLSYTQEYGLELYDGFTTTVVLDYIDLDDLFYPPTTTTSPTTTEPTEPKEYTLTEWIIVGVMAIGVVVMFILMINQSAKRK